MSIAKFPVLFAAAAMGLAAPLAFAQDAKPASVDETNAKDVPACSAKVTDHCMDKTWHKMTHIKAKKHWTKKHHATAKTSATAAPQKAGAPAAKKKI